MFVYGIRGQNELSLNEMKWGPYARSYDEVERIFVSSRPDKEFFGIWRRKDLLKINRTVMNSHIPKPQIWASRPSPFISN